VLDGAPRVVTPEAAPPPTHTAMLEQRRDSHRGTSTAAPVGVLASRPRLRSQGTDTVLSSASSSSGATSTSFDTNVNAPR
jgi:hypothetical protein